MRSSLFKPWAVALALLSSSTVVAQSTKSDCWKTVDSLEQEILKLNQDLRRVKQANPQPAGDRVELENTKKLQQEQALNTALVQLKLDDAFTYKIVDSNHFEITLRPEIVPAIENAYKEHRAAMEELPPNQKQWDTGAWHIMGYGNNKSIAAWDVLSLALHAANHFASKVRGWGSITNPPTANFVEIKLPISNPAFQAFRKGLDAEAAGTMGGFGNLLTAERAGELVVSFTQ